MWGIHFPGLLPRRPKGVSACPMVLDRDEVTRLRFGTVPMGGVQLVALAFRLLQFYTSYGLSTPPMRLKANRQNRFGDFRFPRAGNLRALRVNRSKAKPSPRAQVHRTRRSAPLPWGAVRTPRAEDGAGTAHAIPSAIPKQIPQFTFSNEISLRNKVSTSYLFHNSRRSRNKIELLVL